MDVDVGWGTGLDARLGKGAVFLGFGGGPRVGVEVAEHVDVHAEVRWLTLAGSTWLGRAGAGVHLERGAWQPGAGVDAAVFWGASLRAVTAENPNLVADVAPVLQLRLEPLRFAGERWSAGALRLAIGSGWDRGGPALSLGLTLADVTIRF
ncbi:MAG: hypothetical protein ACOZNI_03780 [Myxococcota bacterium]